MPKVKIAKFSLHKQKTRARRRETIEREFILKDHDWQWFCDTVFFALVVWRDNWTSIISGIQYKNDWEHCEAGHYYPKSYYSLRYDFKNCHAITSGENHKMFQHDIATFKKYKDYMIKNYGQSTLDDLKSRADYKKDFNWVAKARELYSMAFEKYPRQITQRLDERFNKSMRDKYVLEVIINMITGEQNG